MKIFTGDAKVQKQKDYPNFKGKYFIYLPSARAESIGIQKGSKIAYRIEHIGECDSVPRGKFKDAVEGSSHFKKETEETEPIEKAKVVIPDNESIF